NLQWRFNRGAFNPVISDGRNIFVTGHSALYKFRPKGIAYDAVPKPTTAAQVQKSRKKAKQRKAAARARYVAYSKRQRARAIKYCSKQKQPAKCFANWKRKHPYQARAAHVPGKPRKKH